MKKNVRSVTMGPPKVPPYWLRSSGGRACVDPHSLAFLYAYERERPDRVEYQFRGLSFADYQRWRWMLRTVGSSGDVVSLVDPATKPEQRQENTTHGYLRGVDQVKRTGPSPGGDLYDLSFDVESVGG